MRISYCIWAIVALLAAPLGAQTPSELGPTRAYVVFLRGTPVGREEVSVRNDAAGTTIYSQGRVSVPVNTVLQYAELRYDPKGAPELLVVDETIDGTPTTIRASFTGGSAETRTSAQGKTASTTQKISPDSIVIPSGIFAGFTALAPRLAKASAGDEFRLFIVPNAEVTARLAQVNEEQMQTGPTVFRVRRYELTIANGGSDAAIMVTTAADGSLLRVAIPGRSVDVLREDIAGANTRTQVFSNPGDQQVTIPALGFNLAATLTSPAGADPAAKLPAVILVNGQQAPDRDSVATGVPAMSQLAGAFASAGFLAVRYDNRGSGQSGGRTEAAALADYAEDTRAVMKWLTSRKDVDPRRIAFVGHGGGAWIALFAASREKRVGGVAILGGPATKGDQFVLEQQKLQLDEAKASDADRAAKEALQKQIHAAVLTGKGWEQLPPEVRRQADTPWFHSLLAFDPATVIDDVEAPILIVHGDLDREVPVAHAERLAELARKGKSESVSLVTIRGINHLLIPAFTGAVSEYPTLNDHNVSKDLSSAVTGWLTKTLPAPARR
ncbi:MAG TPA: alpha/beta fold hydrolase [Vicinamibacterales bacterium]|nr:alpha/beta fold hydrolase [Vicinamibacterales bacterium]